MDDQQAFGRRLRRLRKARDLTQEVLAQQADCAVDTIKKIEAGVRRPSRQRAEVLADLLALAGSERVAFLQAARAELSPDRLTAPTQLFDRTTPILPQGTVTFLFTDIEGSTRLWERHPQAMPEALAGHAAILRAAIEAHAGVVFRTVGDGVCAAFGNAVAALAAALEAQRALHTAPWGATGPVRVRMALHTGVVALGGDDYLGLPLSRVARVLAAGHGGQTLLSRATAELVRDQLPAGLALRDLGTHRLKDLAQPEHIFQLVAPDLPADFPPLKTLDRPLGGLPAQPTPFIGRDTERMLLRVLLRRADVRLLTLSGPGGAGKTRLALQVAAELRDDFADGVAFVGLAAISDPALITPTIAKALGVIDSGDQPLIARVSDALHEQHLLLVLDNFEHLLPAAPGIAALLAAAPGLKVLATSRAALHLAWEREFPVPPLAVPNRRMLPSLEQLQQYDAVRLFVTRAQSVSANFALTAENAPAVAEICRRLDGLPLAIELAVARIKMFTLPALLARLDDRLTLLTGGPKDLPLRQQTLRATIDWSYNLLEPAERTLFARLGVFAGGCTLAAAEAVCGGWELGVASWGAGVTPPTPILDGLESLVNKSLLQQTHGYAGEPRFGMLEILREYALEQLAASGEWAAIRRQHAAVFLALAEAAAPALEGADQAAWLARLQQEHDNLRAALRWAVEQGETAIGLRFAAALRLFWFMRGYLTEGRERLAQILALGAISERAHAQALDCAGFLARYQGDYAAATGLIGESLAIWRGLGHTQGVADALSNLGYVMLHQGDYPAACALYEESLGLNDALGNQQGRADGLSHLGAAAFYQGEVVAAEQLHEESLAIWRALGDIEGIAYALYNLGDVALSRADAAAAALRFRESLTASVELAWPWGIVSAVEGAAGLAAVHGRPHTSLRLAGFAARLRKTVAIPPALAREQVLARRLEPARRALAEPASVAAWAAGEALALEQAVADAFAELAASAAAGAARAEPPEPAPEAFGGLTAREREVAALVVEGHSNREIAALLVVGLKTVEAHVTRILTKLGFSSRAQIAAWAVAKGLARAPQDLAARAREQ